MNVSKIKSLITDRKVQAFTLLLFLFLPLGAWSQNSSCATFVPDGIEALNEKNYDDAINKFKAAQLCRERYKDAIIAPKINLDSLIDLAQERKINEIIEAKEEAEKANEKAQKQAQKAEFLRLQNLYNNSLTNKDHNTAIGLLKYNYDSFPDSLNKTTIEEELNKVFNKEYPILVRKAHWQVPNPPKNRIIKLVHNRGNLIATLHQSGKINFWLSNGVCLDSLNILEFPVKGIYFSKHHQSFLLYGKNKAAIYNYQLTDDGDISFQQLVLEDFPKIQKVNALANNYFVLCEGGIYSINPKQTLYTYNTNYKQITDIKALPQYENMKRNDFDFLCYFIKNDNLGDTITQLLRVRLKGNTRKIKLFNFSSNYIQSPANSDFLVGAKTKRQGRIKRKMSSPVKIKGIFHDILFFNRKGTLFATFPYDGGRIKVAPHIKGNGLTIASFAKKFLYPPIPPLSTDEKSRWSYSADSIDYLKFLKTGENIWIWNEQGYNFARLADKEDRINLFFTSKNENLLIFGSKDIRLWNISSEDLISRASPGANLGDIKSIFLSQRDKETFTIIHEDFRVSVWSLENYPSNIGRWNQQNNHLKLSREEKKEFNLDLN